MGYIKKILGIGALVLTLGGCDDQPKNYNTYIDLNGDKRQEIVVGNYGQIHSFHTDYNLTTKISNSNGSYGEPRLLMRFMGRPDQIEFSDLDGDGDLDLIFSKYGQSYLRYIDYDTFVAKNDGKGNFGEPELINRQQK